MSCPPNRIWDLVPPSPFRRFPPTKDGTVIKDGEMVIHLDLSDFKAEDIQITFKDDKLTVKAKMERDDHGNKVKQDIEREISIPKNIDKSTLKSELDEDGVLTITAKVSENPDDKKPLEIPIEME